MYWYNIFRELINDEPKRTDSIVTQQHKHIGNHQSDRLGYNRACARVVAGFLLIVQKIINLFPIEMDAFVYQFYIL
jgi:hypothetical protein